MAKQEIIRIHRSETASATPSLTAGELAVNIADRKFFIGGTGGTSDRITFRDELSTVQSVNGASQNIVITGDSASMRVVLGLDLPGSETTTFVISNRIASTSLTGVASFYGNDFSVSPTGEVSISTSGATPVVFRDAFGNIATPKWESTLTLTGGNGVEVHKSNTVSNTFSFTGITASTARSGVASFLSDHFTVSGTGHVSSKGVITINSTPPDGNGNFNIASATVVTGDGGSLRGDGVVITARIAATGATGVASFSSDDFDVSETGHVTVKAAGIGNSQLANSSFTFRDSVQGTDTITLGNTLTVTGGPGISVRKTETTDTFAVQGITATTSTLGVASFNSTYFSVASGAVSLAAPYQATGDSVQAGSGIAISANKTITNIGVTGFNGLTGNITVTGDGGSLVGAVNNRFTNRLATAGATGVASFNSTYFSVASGAVSLAAPYQATGDSVQAGSGIAISANKTIFNIGVTGIGFGSDVGLTGKVNITAGSNITITQSGNLITFSGVAQQVTAVTGDGGAIVGRDNSNITARVSTTGVTGVASFLSTHFAVSGTGHVSLAAAYQATGDTVQAGSGIAISANKTITNIGVTGFNGLTGNITVTGDGGSLVGIANNRFTNRLADASATGVASFNSTYFTVSGGAVSLAAAYQATGDNSRIATSALTGVASFDTRFFTVGSTGHVIFAAAYQATGDSVQAGSGIAISANKTITNIGVTGFNGLTGNITVTGDGGSLVGIANNRFTNRIADASATGVASFNSTYFTVSSGAVSLAAAYQATGDTVITVPGSGIGLSTSGKTDTIFNIGVTSFNGLTGIVSLTGCGGAVRGSDNSCITARLATTGVTGVASFLSTHFTVSGTGHVRLAAAYQATGDSVQAGSGIAISANKTIFNIGVTGFNGLTGNITVTGDSESLVGKDNNRFTNRIASTSLTGVSYFDPSAFLVNADGLVQLRGGSTPPCSNYTNQTDCENNGCFWCALTNQCSAINGCSMFNALYSGMGISSDSQGALTFLYFDIGNLSAAGSGTTILSSDSVLFYDASETGLIKTKRATISKLILDNDNLFTVPSKSSNQLSTTRGSSAIEFDVILGRVAANDQGLIKGATAFAYIEQNTVRTINGLTGALQVVGSINGCSGNSLTITGTVNEVDVTNSCPTITIGLPDNVTIPYISGTGATFTGTVNANLFIGTVSGGTF